MLKQLNNWYKKLSTKEFDWFLIGSIAVYGLLANGIFNILPRSAVGDILVALTAIFGVVLLLYYDYENRFIGWLKKQKTAIYGGVGLGVLIIAVLAFALYIGAE
jgi:4-amino-4-deoxy-L-arabinose transferase-like glycosyltransferase